jgi:hypothetical protein
LSIGRRQLLAAPQSGPLQHAAHVSFDGPYRNKESGSNIRITQPGIDQPENLNLSRSNAHSMATLFIANVAAALRFQQRLIHRATALIGI